MGRIWPLGSLELTKEGKDECMVEAEEGSGHWEGYRSKPNEEGGGREANPYHLVTVKCMPLPSCLDLWPPQDVDKWDGV